MRNLLQLLLIFRPRHAPFHRLFAARPHSCLLSVGVYLYVHMYVHTFIGCPHICNVFIWPPIPGDPFQRPSAADFYWNENIAALSFYVRQFSVYPLHFLGAQLLFFVGCALNWKELLIHTGPGPHFPPPSIHRLCAWLVLA